MDIVRGGVIMAAYVFLVVLLYLFLSSPFDDMMTGFENINLTNSDNEVENASGYGRTVFDMIFGGLVLVPILWFIVNVFIREPDWRYRQ